MNKLIFALSLTLLSFSGKAQSQLALNGRIVSMPAIVKITSIQGDLNAPEFNTGANKEVTYKLAYKIDVDFIRIGTVFQDRKSVWLTYGGGQAGPKYLGQLREDFTFVVETATGVRKTVTIHTSSDSKHFVSVFGSTKNGRGSINGISINTSDSSLVEIH